jgi:hypothetical protein
VNSSSEEYWPPQGVYHYNPAEERRAIQWADEHSPVIIANWAEKRDDFEPDNGALIEWHAIPGEQSLGNGDGAIWSLEYLRRRERSKPE